MRSHTTCRECPPPAAQPLTTATTTFGIVRISRCTSRMCSRPPAALTRAGSTVSAVSPSRTGSPTRPRIRWSPPEQNAQPPSLADGPLPVSSTQPTSGVIRAWSSTRYSSSTVCGRNALRTSGRSNAIRTVPRPGPSTHRPVVGDVGQVEALHRRPAGGIEGLGHGGRRHVREDRRMDGAAADRAGVVAIPMRTRFRGIDVREGLLAARAGRLGRVLAVPGLRREPSACRGCAPRARRRTTAGRRPSVRRCRSTSPCRRSGRSAPPTSSALGRLPHREGQGRRARPDRGRRPGAGRGRPRRARARRAGSGSTPTAPGTSTPPSGW